MVLFPTWLPLHTARLWSYCRTVYMPMTYLYGKRYQAPLTDIISSCCVGYIASPLTLRYNSTIFI